MGISVWLQFFLNMRKKRFLSEAIIEKKVISYNEKYGLKYLAQLKLITI